MRAAALLALLCTTVACNADLGPEDGPTNVRFVNAVPDALSPLQFALTPGPSATLSYGASTEYMAIEPRVYGVQIRDESDGWAVSGNVEVVGGIHQTLIAFGTTGEEGAILVSDNPGRPRAGTSNVRFLHLAPQSATLDVHVLADSEVIEPERPLYGTLTYPSNPGHLRVTARTARIIVTAGGTDDILFRSDLLPFETGANYSVIITNNDEGAVQLIRLPDGA